MNKTVRLASVLISLFTITTLTACSSSRLATRWNDTDYKGPVLEKVLVVGVMKDDSRRRHYETEFVKKLTADGRKAVASYALMPDLKAVDDKDELVAIINQAGADSVLITTLKAVKKEEREVPPRVDYVPSMGMGYGYYPYYLTSYQAVYSPGYTTVDTVVHLETRVFALSTGDLVWAGNTESVNAGSADKIISETANLIVTDMKKSGLLK
jgi:hypothetical protein